MARHAVLLFCCLPLVVVHAEFDLVQSVKNLPNAVRKNMCQFRDGTGQMWSNHKLATAVKKRVRQGGDPLSYHELQLLQKSSEDTGKLFQAAALWIVAPELIPALLYFFPRALPSTFETTSAAKKRQESCFRARAIVTLKFLVKLEETSASKGNKGRRATAQRTLAMRMLRAQSVTDAVLPVYPLTVPVSTTTRTRKRSAKACAIEALNPLPQPLVKLFCQLLGLSVALPGPMRRSSLARHMVQLVEEDAALSRQKLSSLSRAELVEACLDRGIGRLNSTESELRQWLKIWLLLVSPEAKRHTVSEPHRLRLAIIAAAAISTSRGDEALALPRLLLRSK